MAKAVDAAESAIANDGPASTTTSGPALVAALEAAESAAATATGEASASTGQQQGQNGSIAAGAGAEGAAGGEGGGAMEVDVVPLATALSGALKGVVDHEPAAALKTAAATLLRRFG